MRTRSYLLLLMGGLVLHPAATFAFTSKFTINLSDFSQIFDPANGSLVLQNPSGSKFTIGQGSNACPNVDQINISPPSAQRNQWMSILLLSWTAQKSIVITGDCSGSSITSASTSSIASIN